MNCENIRHVHIIYDLYYLYFAGIYNSRVGVYHNCQLQSFLLPYFLLRLFGFKKNFNYNFAKNENFVVLYIYIIISYQTLSIITDSALQQLNQHPDSVNIVS